MQPYRNEIHLKAIKETFSQLYALDDRTRAPASLEVQYIGTGIDTTLALITSAYNAILPVDKPNMAYIAYEKEENFHSLLNATCRSFHISIVLSIEMAIKHNCEKNGLEIKSAYKNNLIKEFSKLRNVATEDLLPHIEKFETKITKSIRPGFNDYLEAVLKNPIFKDKPEEVRKWRYFFNALAVLRNKSAHSDVELSDDDRQKLIDGGLSANIDANTGRLVYNVIHFHPICLRVLEFCDIIS